MAAPTEPTCPTCGARLAHGDFLCPRCEVIVDAGPVEENPEPPREPTVVRALLSPPESTLVRRAPTAPPQPGAAVGDRRHITRTRIFTVPAGSDDIPTIVDGLDLRTLSLSTFEAYFLSMTDGRSTVEQLRQMAGLSKVETQSVLRSLIDRGVVRVLEAPPRRAPRTAETPVPTLELTESDIAEPTRPPPPRAPPRETSAPVRREPAAPPAEARPPAKSVGTVAPPRPPPRPAPRVPESPLQRAIALERRGDVEQAIKVLEGAIAHSCDPAPLYNRLAIALLKERRDFAEAEELLRRALEIDGDNEVYRQNLMKVLTMAAALTGRHRLPRRSGD